MLKKIGLLLLTLGLLLVAMLFEDTESQTRFLYSLYYLSAIGAFGLGYIDIANPIKLGFGITRFAIFRKFTLSVFMMVVMLWIIHFISALFVGLIYNETNWISFFELDAIFLLSLLIVAYSQIGMLMGNVHLKIWVGLPIMAMISSLIVWIVLKQFLLWWFFILLLIVSIVLWIANFMLIKNLRIERS